MRKILLIFIALFLITLKAYPQGSFYSGGPNNPHRVKGNFEATGTGTFGGDVTISGADFKVSDNTPYWLLWDSDTNDGYMAHAMFNTDGDPYQGFQLWRVSGTLANPTVNYGVPLFWLKKSDNGIRVRDSITNTLMGLHPAATITVASSTSRGKEHADYICDGTADEVEIQAAIDALPDGYTDGSGGKVLLLEGLYNISTTITITNKPITLEGLGRWGQTLLKLTNGANTRLLTVSGVFHPVIRNIHFDGNKTNQTGGDYLIYFTGSGYPNIYDCYVMNAYAIGINMGVQDLYAENVYVEFSGGRGWDIIAYQNIMLLNCTAWDNGSDGVRIYTTDSRDVSIIGLRTANNSGSGIFLSGCSKIGIIGGYNYLNDTHGIQIDDATDIAIEGVTIRNNSQAANNTSSGIYVQGTSSRVTVTNCNIVSDVATKQKYGIEEAESANNNVYHGNSLSGNSTGQIFLAGASSMAYGNDGYAEHNLIGNLTLNNANLTLTAGYDIRPSANSTTALNIAQADGTDFVVFDTTNKRVGIDQTTPLGRLHIKDNTSTVANTIAYFEGNITNSAEATIQVGAYMNSLYNSAIFGHDFATGAGTDYGFVELYNGTRALKWDSAGNVTVAGTLTVNGDQTGAADHVFDSEDDISLLYKWRNGEILPFQTGDMLNRDRLLRDTIIQLNKKIEDLEVKIKVLEAR